MKRGDWETGRQGDREAWRRGDEEARRQGGGANGITLNSELKTQNSKPQTYFQIL